VSICISPLYFLFLCEMSLEFWSGWHWTCILLLVVWPFYHVDSTNPWAWEIFPFSGISFEFSYFSKD
jgi:hypothetical protein